MHKIFVFITVIMMMGLLMSNELKAERPKATFKVLFSDDFTNMESCTSPYHAKGQNWTPETLESAVDETAGIGIQVHMLQPAHGWVPWWQSKIYPVEEHNKWWKEYFGVDIPYEPVQQFILDGGDPFKVFIERCKKDNLVPFISLRMNDAHHLEHVETKGNTVGPHAICKFYAEHPEYRIGPNLKSWDDVVQNWAISEVREYKYNYIKEICENYDIAGFEMDFMRHPVLFQVDKTTPEQRKQIITDFIKSVRKVLDDTARDGQYRWLCVRIPYRSNINKFSYDDLGIDLPAWTAAGVDMVNMSAYYYTVQQTELTSVIKSIPDTPVYLELCHCTMSGKSLNKKGGDNYNFRRTTDEQYYTAVHLAYARGAAGVSAFNFVYYRQHGSAEDDRGPFNEPPFHIFKGLGDPEWLATQPQHYIYAKSWMFAMPMDFTEGAVKNFKMDMAPTKVAPKSLGRLRVQSDEDMTGSAWSVKVNGFELQPSDDISEPYESPYTALLGDETTLRSWIVPKEILKNGYNDFEIKMDSGDKKVRISYIDLAVK